MKIWGEGVPGRGNNNSKGLTAALCLGFQNKWVTGKLKASEGKRQEKSWKGRRGPATQGLGRGKELGDHSKKKGSLSERS